MLLVRTPSYHSLASGRIVKEWMVTLEVTRPDPLPLLCSQVAMYWFGQNRPCGCGCGTSLPGARRGCHALGAGRGWPRRDLNHAAPSRALVQACWSSQGVAAIQVAHADEAEEQVGGVGGVALVAEFINDEDLRVHVRLDRRLQATGECGVGGGADEFVAGGEARVLNGSGRT